MKKFFVLIISLSIHTLFAQDIDDQYLETLPEDIRNEIEKSIQLKNETEKPLYRKASTKINKDDEKLQMQVFGSVFFDTIQSTFMPINEPNLDSSYVLDFGDVLEIQLVGQIDSIDDYQIKRDGSINILDIGSISLSGLSMNDASKLIKTKVDDAYIGTEVYVSLKNVRDITVLIAGNAFNPGIYTLNGNSNMLHALSMAGGISNIGSYRSIDLVRDGSIVNSLDIYDVLIDGKSNFKNSLRSGDSIVVNPSKNIISIQNGVLRPGIYELTEDETIIDLIRFANGFSNYANKDEIVVSRFEQGNLIKLYVDIKNTNLTPLNSGDVVFIDEFKFDNVLIEGAVRNPGSYKMPKGSTLSNLIITAGGYTDQAYPFAGFLNNENALKVNNEAKTKLYNAFLNNLIMNNASEVSNNSDLSIFLRQIQEAEVSGRIIAEFDLDIIKANPNFDTILENNDKVFIPSITQQVFIQGEIHNPGALRYSPNKDIAYYIENSGGSKKSADVQNVFIIHPNGETKTLKSNSRLSFVLAENEKSLIYPGSIIYVPMKSDFTNGLQAASIWAPILSSVALSLTSLSVLNNQN